MPESKPASTLADRFMPQIGVPALYQGARLEDFLEHHPGIEVPLPNQSGIFITGDTGTGKTYLAAALLAEHLPECIVGAKVTKWERDGKEHRHTEYGHMQKNLWTTAPEFLAELRASFAGRGESESEILRKYASVNWLVLDDIGAQRNTDWTAESIYLLLSRRINRKLPTIVTSNLKLEELDRQDPRLASRLGAMAYLLLEGKDRRLEADRG